MKQTILQPNGVHRQITESDIVKAVRLLQKKLNWWVFSNQVKRGAALKWAATVEGDNRIKHLHVHILIEVPKSCDAGFFCLIVQSCWWSNWLQANQMRVQPVRSIDDVTGYILKTGGDAVCLKTLHI